jgi:hypothetical protein
VKGWQGGQNWISAGSFQTRQDLSMKLIKNIGNPNSTAFNPYNYVGQVPNGLSATETAGEILPTLIETSIPFALGPLETELLIPDPAATDVADLLIAGSTGFAVRLAQLPEFQLC